MSVWRVSVSTVSTRLRLRPGEAAAAGTGRGGLGPRIWSTWASLITCDLTLTRGFQLSETLRKCLQSWLESRQTSLLLWVWRSEERWVSDGDFIATNSSQNRSTPFKSYYSLLLTNTKGDYFDKQAPIYDSLVLRFWFIPDKNKYWTNLYFFSTPDWDPHPIKQ